MVGNEKRHRTIWREFYGLMFYLLSAILLICCCDDFTVVCYGDNTRDTVIVNGDRINTDVTINYNKRITKRNIGEKVTANTGRVIVEDVTVINNGRIVTKDVEQRCR